MSLPSLRENLLPVDTSNPVNRQHFLSQGRVAWWLALPDLTGGLGVYDLLGLYHMRIVSMAGATRGWKPTTRPGGFSHLAFDGTNDYLRLTSTPSAFTYTSGGFSVAAWVKTTGNAGVIASTIDASTFGGWEFCISQGNPVVQAGKPSLWNGAAWVSSSVTVNDGAWHRVLVAHAPGGPTVFYVDGKAAVSAAHNDPNAKTNDLEVGTRFQLSTATINFNGSMDDIGVWKRSLNALEAQEDYQLSLLGYPGVLNRIDLVKHTDGGAAPSTLVHRSLMMGVGI